MKSDEEIARDVRALFDPSSVLTSSPGEERTALVRAGRREELQWVLDLNISSDLRDTIRARLAELTKGTP